VCVGGEEEKEPLLWSDGRDRTIFVFLTKYCTGLPDDEFSVTRHSGVLLNIGG